MLHLDRIPAVKRIGTTTLEVFAIEISGEFTAADAENLCGLLDGAYALKDQIRLLIRINALENLDVSALDNETARQLRHEAGQHIERCAIIDGEGWAGEISSLLGSRLDKKVFSPNSEAEAWAFVGAREVAEDI